MCVYTHLGKHVGDGDGYDNDSDVFVSCATIGKCMASDGKSD